MKALLASEDTWFTRHCATIAGSDLARTFADQTIQRMLELRILDDASSKAATRVGRWIIGAESR